MVAVVLALLSLALGAYAADLEAIIPAKYERVWWDRGGMASDDFICWAPKPTDSTNYKCLGHRGQKNHDDIEAPIMAFRDVSGDALAKAIGATMIWDDRRAITWHDGSSWRLTCPTGYVAVGDFFYDMNRIENPGDNFYYANMCVKKSLTDLCSLEGGKIWDDSGSLAKNDVSVWQAKSDDTFLGGFLYTNNVHEKPPKMEIRCLLKSSYTVTYV